MIDRARGIVLNFDVRPEDVCGGVFVNAPDDTRRLVPVTPRDEYAVPDSFSSLWEYADADGNTLACLLRVASGQLSPIWSICPDAGEDVDKIYYEHHRTVAGAGLLLVERCAEIDHRSIEHHELSTMGAVEIHRGDSFTVASAMFTGTDTYVLATFPGAPFQDHYETRTD
jgi:hypothetical protein